MALFNVFNNEPFFTEFDRLFDEAFARRTGGGSQVQRQSGNNAPRVLLPRYVRLVLISTRVCDTQRYAQG